VLEADVRKIDLLIQPDQREDALEAEDSGKHLRCETHIRGEHLDEAAWTESDMPPASKPRARQITIVQRRCDDGSAVRVSHHRQPGAVLASTQKVCTSQSAAGGAQQRVERMRGRSATLVRWSILLGGHFTQHSLTPAFRVEVDRHRESHRSAGLPG
jgi:hypothetical protein